MPQALKTLPAFLDLHDPLSIPSVVSARLNDFYEDARSAHELLALVGVLAGMLDARCTSGPTRSEALEESRQWLEASGLSLMPITAPAAPEPPSPCFPIRCYQCGKTGWASTPIENPLCGACIKKGPKSLWKGAPLG